VVALEIAASAMAYTLGMKSLSVQTAWDRSLPLD
jgi:hypothetical protein